MRMSTERNRNEHWLIRIRIEFKWVWFIQSPNLAQKCGGVFDLADIWEGNVLRVLNYRHANTSSGPPSTNAKWCRYLNEIALGEDVAFIIHYRF